MLTSRGLNILRAIRRTSKFSRENLQQTRNTTTDNVYRGPGIMPARKNVVAAEIFGGIAWWWILWHLWHESDHITGEFDYPDPSKWTDAELGIPPDDEDV